LATRRKAATASYPRGLTDRQDIARHRACAALGTQALRDPPCDLCGSLLHLSDECDFIERDACQLLDVAPEDPAIGIHRAIVHRLYLEACNLYQLIYPLFYPGCRSTPAAVPTLVGPDYLQLAISHAVDDFLVIPGFCSIDIRHQRPGYCLVAQLYYSKVFPLTFGDFCCQIADRIDATS
jgi:hypothetical protein